MAHYGKHRHRDHHRGKQVEQSHGKGIRDTVVGPGHVGADGGEAAKAGAYGQEELVSSKAPHFHRVQGRHLWGEGPCESACKARRGGGWKMRRRE